MSRFCYIAHLEGIEVRGILEGVSKSAVVAELKRQGLNRISVRPHARTTGWRIRRFFNLP